MTKLMGLLGVAGLLPFIIASGLAMVQQPLFGHAASTLFVTYSASILAFLSGSLWGRETHALQNNVNDWVMGLSNVLCLLAWLCLLLTATLGAVALLMLGYITTLIVERRQATLVGIDPSYLKLRTLLTAVAVGCHVVMLLGL
ncbi:DUF3429 domain-containing protein [Shewanella waksmanii]|uniref:DUF3429 domain-containing protein n=1 Tax=Shewanella waksmanii TaxID=213783 RepID=UPI000686CE89|nr:DUF3429 domain-containing protein [Shewanella waksmanii]